MGPYGPMGVSAEEGQVSTGFHIGLHIGLHIGTLGIHGFLGIFRIFSGIFGIFGQILGFLVKIT